MKSRAKASGRGLFPHTRARGNTNQFGGSAGNSSSNNRPPASEDGFKAGSLGDRASRPGGGAKNDAKLAGRPTPNEHAGTGVGGFAFDPSLGKYDIGGYAQLDSGKARK